MNREFWTERWRQGRIGFHQSEINAALQRFFPTLGVERGSAVFVPLCGKSRDMLWLAEQGYHVVGVELIETAVTSFFEENGLTYTTSASGSLVRYESGAIVIYCGDVFALTEEHLDAVRGVFDRAALIALPAQTRRAYADHLRSILPSGWTMLLATLEYDEALRSGPPFSVREPEVRALFGDVCDIELLERRGSSRSNDSDDVREAAWALRWRGAR
jgi:thiopurine S-methyltransferase